MTALEQFHVDAAREVERQRAERLAQLLTLQMRQASSRRTDAGILPMNQSPLFSGATETTEPQTLQTSLFEE